MVEMMKFGCVSLLACALALAAYAGSDPFAGTWKLNLAKSKLQSPAPASDSVRIEVDANNIRIDQEGTNDKGAAFKLAVLGGFDDSFYGVAGCAYFDSVSFRRTSKSHIVAEVRKSGTVVEWVDAEVSGNVLKVSLTAVDGAGKETKSLAILQRE